MYFHRINTEISWTRSQLFSCLSYQLQCKIDEYSMSPLLLKNLYYASLSCHEAFRKSHQLTIHVEYIVNLCYRYLRKNNNSIRHILQLLAPITHHEQECVFVWLNAGCVLHLQVADSIPAQVSGSQSVFCMCAVVVPHPPPLLCSLICPSFFPLSEQPLLFLFWKRRHG